MTCLTSETKEPITSAIFNFHRSVTLENSRVIKKRWVPLHFISKVFSSAPQTFFLSSRWVERSSSEKLCCLVSALTETTNVLTLNKCFQTSTKIHQSAVPIAIIRPVNKWMNVTFHSIFRSEICEHHWCFCFYVALSDKSME